jgi:hypothetical protein
MNGMSLIGWLGSLLILLLLIAVGVSLVRTLSSKPGSGETSGSNILLIVLATIGVVVLLGFATMLFMHWGMGQMMG